MQHLVTLLVALLGGGAVGGALGSLITFRFAGGRVAQRHGHTREVFEDERKAYADLLDRMRGIVEKQEGELSTLHREVRRLEGINARLVAMLITNQIVPADWDPSHHLPHTVAILAAAATVAAPESGAKKGETPPPPPGPTGAAGAAGAASAAVIPLPVYDPKVEKGNAEEDAASY